MTAWSCDYPVLSGQSGTIVSCRRKAIPSLTWRVLRDSGEGKNNFQGTTIESSKGLNSLASNRVESTMTLPLERINWTFIVSRCTFSLLTIWMKLNCILRAVFITVLLSHCAVHSLYNIYMISNDSRQILIHCILRAIILLALYDGSNLICMRSPTHGVHSTQNTSSSPPHML